MKQPSCALFLASALLLGGMIAVPGRSFADGDAMPRMFGKEHPFSIEDLPPGRFRSRLESLSPKAQARALHWLHSFHFPINDLETMVIDDEGGVLYADPANVHPGVPQIEMEDRPLFP